MNLWLSKGAPANKLVLGIPFYGRTFRLTNTSLTGINEPASGEAEEGEFTKSKSTLAFYEVLLLGFLNVNCDKVALIIKFCSLFVIDNR